MSTFDVAFIGTGPEPDNPVIGESFAMAYRHAAGYERLDQCDLVACADLVQENAEAFANNFAIAAERVYEDYEIMLDEVEPDIVSVATPVPTHAPIVLDCLRSGVLDAVHCEKPMATTWGDARLMAQEANRRGVQLTFNHQNRMTSPWRDANRLLDDGEIGTLQRIEVACGELLDNGTHFIDLANMYNDQRRIEWVLGQIDYREEQIKYGAHNENQGLALWKYENDVYGFASTGYGGDAVPGAVRLLGTEGIITLSPTWADADPLRIRGRGDDAWRSVDVEQDGIGAIEVAIEHLVSCLEQGEEPELSARRALDTTEIIFSAYESARRGGRVDLPLTIDDNPLEAMVDAGELMPTNRAEQ